jgi:hypothetical protein
MWLYSLFNLGTILGWVVNATLRPLYNPGKTRYPLYRRLGGPPGPVWTSAENLAPTGIRSPDRPARSQSLHRLSYPDPRQYSTKPKITNTELANHRCRIPANIITAAMRIIYQIKNRDIWASRKMCSGYRDFLKRYSPWGKKGRMGPHSCRKRLRVR